MPSSTLVVSDLDRVTLESWTRSSTVSAGQRERPIVLAVADGTGVSGTARTCGGVTSDGDQVARPVRR